MRETFSMRCSRLIAWWVLVALAVGNVFGQDTGAPMSISDAFNAGAAAGAGTQSIHDTITSGSTSSYSPQNVVSSYSTTTPSQSSYWTGPGTGTAGVTAGGNSTIAGCQNSSDPTTATAQCNAINAVISTKSNAPPPMVTTNDPIYTQGHAVINDPTSIIGTASNYYTGCNTSTTTTPGNVTQDKCETYTSITSNTCAKTETVNVDALYNYQCTTTPFVQTAQTCHKVANVTVTQTGSGMNCTPGQLLASYQNYYQEYARIYCTGVPNVVQIDTGRMSCHGSVTVTVPTNITVATYNSYGWCGVYYQYYHYISCSGSTCQDQWQNKDSVDRFGWSFYYTTGNILPFTAPGSNMVITKTVTWTDQCLPYE